MGSLNRFPRARDLHRFSFATWRALGVLLLATWTLIACSESGEQSTGEPARPARPLVETVLCAVEPADYLVTGQGFLAPSEQISVVSEVAGTVEYVSPNLFPGGLLEAGEILFRIEQQTFAAQRARSEAQVISARAALAQARATLERQAYLESIGATAQSAKEAAQAAEAASEARVAEARAQFELLSEQLRDTEIRAPFRARVTSEQVTLGMFIQPGLPVAEIFDVASGELVIGLSFDEARAVQRRIAGDNAHEIQIFRPDDTQPLPVAATIASVDPQVDPETRTVNFRIALPEVFIGEDANTPALLNEYLEAQLPARSQGRLFSAPRGVVRRESYVFAVESDGRLKKVTVRPVMRRDDRVYFGADADLDGKVLLLTTLAEEQDGLAVRVAGQEADAARPANIRPGSDST